jgi:hypothetical protein
MYSELKIHNNYRLYNEFISFISYMFYRAATGTGNNNNNQNTNNNNNNNHNNTIEIHRMWNVKTRVLPVIIEATETISKSFRKYVSTIPGNHEVKVLQKTAMLGTAHILRKVLMSQRSS